MYMILGRYEEPQLSTTYGNLLNMLDPAFTSEVCSPVSDPQRIRNASEQSTEHLKLYFETGREEKVSSDIR